MKAYRLAVVIRFVLFGAGCFSPRGGRPTETPVVSSPNSRSAEEAVSDLVPETPSPSPSPTDSRHLFPTTNLEVRYRFTDNTESREFLIPDGNRLVQTYNGHPYITWFFAAGGVFRSDPSDTDGKLLVRYLPSE